MGLSQSSPGCLSFPGPTPLPAFPEDTSYLASSYQLLSQDLLLRSLAKTAALSELCH